MSGDFYRAFEDRHRGSRELIKERLRAYLPLIAPLAGDPENATALDLGCGRGEWLELLGEHTFAARGVDLDDGMLAACREHGLSVETADAIGTLSALPDNSLAVVSAFHLVEHLPFDAVQELVVQSLRVLQPGGLLIMETPNPENPMVGACHFYLDPSHIRPIPPDLLSFVTEHAGFARQKVMRLQEEPSLHTKAAIHLINVFASASPDYGVVAQKAAPADVMARFDVPFQRTFGISIGELAQRFDEQAHARHQALSQQLIEHQTAMQERVAQLAEKLDTAVAGQGLLNTHLAASDMSFAETLSQMEKARTEQALMHSADLSKLETRLSVTNAMQAQTAETVSQLHQRLDSMLTSRSWRITAPLRWLERLLRR